MFTAGSCDELWGDGGTYKEIPYDALPPLEETVDSFAWLREAPAAKHGLVLMP